MSTTKTKVLTNAVLKSMLPDTVSARGKCTDLNTCIQAGIYSITESALNLPPGAPAYGVLIVQVSSYYGLQTFVTRTSATMFIRTFIAGPDTSDFSEWRKVQPVAISEA